MNEPGFLRCKVIAKVDGRNYEGMATVAVDEERIRPTTADPKDFDSFWKQAIEDARKTSLDPENGVDAGKMYVYAKRLSCQFSE